MPLRIAAKVDKVDREYFETVIQPLLDRRLIEFIGEVDDQQKRTLLSNIPEGSESAFALYISLRGLNEELFSSCLKSSRSVSVRVLGTAICTVT